MSMKISVIVPVYNVEDYLERCIESIEAQTYRNFEIILVDDGSTDNSGKICDNLKDIYKNITVLHKTNSGVSATRNLGIDTAHGNYIIFVDSDDCIAPEMFKKLMDAQEKYPERLPVCGIKKVFPNREQDCIVDGESFFPVDKKDFFIIQKAQMFNCIYNKLFNKQVLDSNSIRFNPEMEIGEDMVFNADYVMKSNCDFIVLNEALYYYNVFVNNSLSKKYIPDIFKNYLIMDEKFQELFRFTDTDMVKYQPRYSTILLYGMIHSIQNTISPKNNDSAIKKIKHIKFIINSFDIRKIIKQADNKKGYSSIYLKILYTRCATLIYLFRTIKK